MRLAGGFLVMQVFQGFGAAMQGRPQPCVGAQALGAVAGQNLLGTGQVPTRIMLRNPLIHQNSLLIRLTASEQKQSQPQPDAPALIPWLGSQARPQPAC